MTTSKKGGCTLHQINKAVIMTGNYPPAALTSLFCRGFMHGLSGWSSNRDEGINQVQQCKFRIMAPLNGCFYSVVEPRPQKG